MRDGSTIDNIKLGYWGSAAHGGMAITMLDGTAMEWLEGADVGRRASVELSTSFSLVTIRPDALGGLMSLHTARGVPFYRYVSCDCPTSFVPDGRMTAFEMHQAEVSWHDDGGYGYLTAQLALEHQLPWPRIREACASYNPSALAEECLRRRLRSAVRHGRQNLEGAECPPKYIRRLLPPGTWARLVREARREIELGEKT